MLDLSRTLLHGILRATVSLSNSQKFLPLKSICTEENEAINDERRSAIAKVACFLPDEACFTANKISLRYA